MATVKENLIAAKALIDTPEKWIKGQFRDENGCLCARGACGIASGKGFASKEASRSESQLIRFLPPRMDGHSWQIHGPLSALAHYNDDPDTTHADIMALFDRAIAAQDEVAS